jgi:hypothetical protein
MGAVEAARSASATYDGELFAVLRNSILGG